MQEASAAIAVVSHAQRDAVEDARGLESRLDVRRLRDVRARSSRSASRCASCSTRRCIRKSRPMPEPSSRLTLLGWGIGGLIGGVLADYIGRRRMMIYAILAYSLMTGLSALRLGLGVVRGAAVPGRHRHRIGMGDRRLDDRGDVARSRARQRRRPDAMRARHRVLPGLVRLAVRRRDGPGGVALHVCDRRPAGAAHALDPDRHSGIAAMGARPTKRRQAARRAPARRCAARG